MHKFKNNYKNCLKRTISMSLCIICFGFLGSVSAFQISGGGNNLQVIQTNHAKSSSFQVNAKLKPTAIGKNIQTSFFTPPPVTPTTPTPSTTSTIPVVASSGGGSDGSSPYLGTADWSKQGRSQRATEQRLLAKNKDALAHTSAPKEIIDNLTTQIITEPVISRDLPKTDSPEITTPEVILNNPVIEKENTYNPQTDKFIAINDSQVEINPAKFSLKFLKKDLIQGNNDKNYCKSLSAYVFNNNDHWYIIAKALFLIVICLTGIFFCLAILVYFMWKKSKKKQNPAKKSLWKKFLKLLPILFLIVSGTSNYASAGPVTTPQQLIYEGDLLDNAGNPLTGNYSFRFSLWDNQDFEATDNIAGVLNVGAPDYFGWQEIQSQSLTDGKFSLKLGTVTPFFAGLFNRTNMYLQIEVKDAAAPDTSYELIDLNINDALIDRTSIDTIPFAFNADKLDFRDTGYAPGEIPFIDPTTGKLPASIIESAAAGIVDGVDGNTFALDLNGDATATDNLVLKFGDILNKTLSWNGVNDQFEFSDDLSVAGNLVVSGTVNGISIGPKNKIEVLSPRYPNSIISEDGSDNSGSMFEEVAAISGKAKNTLRWNTRQTDIQDFDVVIRYTLPANFAGFQGANPLSLEFMTEGSFTDSKVDLVVEKEGSATDELNGAGIGFNSNAWTTVDLGLNPATIWNPNDTLIIRVKMYSRNNLQSHISDIVLKYIEN